MINTSSLFSIIDFAGVFAGAMGGALEAKQNRTYQFDFVGVIGLGFISALGGGITRDILLQHGPSCGAAPIQDQSCPQISIWRNEMDSSCRRFSGNVNRVRCWRNISRMR